MKIILIIFIFLNIIFNTAYAMKIAITVDDLPANGELAPDDTRLKIAKKMLNVFDKHHITGVYGLINAARVEEDKNNLIILEEWVRKGHYLGNHTYSHLDLAKVDINEYLTDIKKDEPLLIKLMGDKNYKYFRYPYLSEGDTQEKRDKVRHFLFSNHYQIAPVTVDFFEYEWNSPYVRCQSKNDYRSIEWLKKSYLEQSLNALTIAHELSTLLFNHDIKNILLIHMNSMTADMLDELLTAYEKQGVQFISLSDALTDEVYKINPNIVRDRAYTFLNQIRLSRGLKNPEIVAQLYDTLPEEKLNNICR